MGKIIKLALIIFVVWFLVTSPTQASALVRSGLSALESVAQSGADFLNSL
jgi:hypothetical protein